ncbi:hypothetical protein JM946_10590 [Steroidobacter sp. S1-65]|uniref:Uncharacterized protein n=1 Tax=Steroidobacter gossypii TaxID=2805490 RepID=A0ABS1WW49_9GAMM|nr:hypothetical protein [Steroidobacter gossypii]MBM0105202.1 hypothetical protein [Steroidobacter gossypii]
MSRNNITVQPTCTKQSAAAERCKQIKAGIDAELGQLHKTNALLICAQYTANYAGDVEIDISDALAAIIALRAAHRDAGSAGTGGMR